MYPIGILPAGKPVLPTSTVVLLSSVAVKLSIPLVLGKGDGAEELRMPATNLKISDTSVFESKLLKYEPSKLSPQALFVGYPTLWL